MATNGVLSLPAGPQLDNSNGKLSGSKPWNLEHRNSIVDDLLFEIYDRWHDGRHDSFESDTFTECSSTSEAFHWRRNSQSDIHGHAGRLHRANLETQSVDQLKKLLAELQHRTNFMSSRLVRQLKRRERRQNKLQHNCDIVTAIMQAASQKRRIDTRLRFSLEPPPGDSAFDQWKDAMQAVARLPLGIPDGFRKKVWLSLAENHIKELHIDWEKTVRFVFNERSNPDDNTLGLQIVKDLHRTGCSGFSGQDNEEDRAVLKRVLLAYARWNKNVGYCQGFNVIAALLLEVMDRKEDEALMVMIYLIDHVLPNSYFANNLRALSVDMAVFRDLLGLMFPKLSRHLDYLQYAAQDQTTGASYEPPLTNVFTMQWFLTMFATCLPKDVVLRVWDSILLEGSEILLRTALAIWGKLSRRILSVGSADEFYSLMGILTQDMMEGRIFNADALIKFIYSCAPFPMQQLPELREKYTYNIRPFSSAGGSKKANVVGGMVLPSDDDELDEDDLEAITCFTGILPGQITQNKAKGIEGDHHGSTPDISALGPGAYGAGPDSSVLAGSNLYLERMSTDISSLKKQYRRLKQRQTQAHIILAAASAKQQAKANIIIPKIETPRAMNHLFVGKNGKGTPLGRNRLITDSPRIAPGYPQATLVHHYLQEVKKQKSPSRRSRNMSERSDRSVIERTSSVDSSASEVSVCSSVRKVEQNLPLTESKHSCDIDNENPSDDTELCTNLKSSTEDGLNENQSNAAEKQKTLICDSMDIPQNDEGGNDDNFSSQGESPYRTPSESSECGQDTAGVPQKIENSCDAADVQSNVNDIDTDSWIDGCDVQLKCDLDSVSHNKLKYSSDDDQCQSVLERCDEADSGSQVSVNSDIPVVTSESTLETSENDMGIEKGEITEDLSCVDSIQNINNNSSVVADKIQESSQWKDLSNSPEVDNGSKPSLSNVRIGAQRLPKLDIGKMSSITDSECSPQEYSKHSSDSDSCPVFSPGSGSERCYSYDEKSLSDRSLSRATSIDQSDKSPQKSHQNGLLKNHNKSLSTGTSIDPILSDKTISEHLGNYSKSKSALASTKVNSKPFSPFPVRHFNENRAKTGLKLGLYKMEQLGKQRKALWSK